MRTIKTYSNRAPFYNALIRSWESGAISRRLTTTLNGGNKRPNLGRVAHMAYEGAIHERFHGGEEVCLEVAA